LITGVIRNVDNSTIADADELSSLRVISRQTSLRNQHRLVLAVDPASDEWRTSHASPGERYEDRVRYLAFGTAGGAYDGR
jgi:hypothetical protein